MLTFDWRRCWTKRQSRQAPHRRFAIPNNDVDRASIRWDGPQPKSRFRLSEWGTGGGFSHASFASDNTALRASPPEGWGRVCLGQRLVDSYSSGRSAPGVEPASSIRPSLLDIRPFRVRIADCTPSLRSSIASQSHVDLAGCDHHSHEQAHRQNQILIAFQSEAPLLFSVCPMLRGGSGISESPWCCPQNRRVLRRVTPTRRRSRHESNLRLASGFGPSMTAVPASEPPNPPSTGSGQAPCQGGFRFSRMRGVLTGRRRYHSPLTRGARGVRSPAARL